MGPLFADADAGWPFVAQVLTGALTVLGAGYFAMRTGRDKLQFDAGKIALDARLTTAEGKAELAEERAAFAEEKAEANTARIAECEQDRERLREQVAGLEATVARIGSKVREVERRARVHHPGDGPSPAGDPPPSPPGGVERRAAPAPPSDT